MQLLRTEYRVFRNKPIVHLFLRENGKRRVETDSSLIPYFYVTVEEADKVDMEYDTGIYTAFDGTKLRKVLTTLPEDVPELRLKFKKTYEADIVFPVRYLIDKVDTLEKTDFKTFYLDIETDNAGSVPNPDLAEFPVVCIGIYDNMTGIYSTFVHRQDFAPGTHSSTFDDTLHEINYFKSEEDMLTGLVEFFHKEEPDVVTGWNLVQFDMRYLLNRMFRLNINSNGLSPMGSSYAKGNHIVVKGIALLDLIQAYQKLSTGGGEESYTLDYIGKKVVKQGKIDTGAGIGWLWKHDIDHLMQYNLMDVKITRMIDEKMKLIDFLDEIRRLSFCQLEDTLTTTRTLDSYVLKLQHGKIVLPTRIKHEEQAQFKGAFVNSWAKGMYQNVVVFDLKSLYPSVLVSFNLSLETMNNGSQHYIEVNGHKIDTKKGFLTEVVEHLWQSRAQYKKLMKGEKLGSDAYELYNGRQKAIKILLNGLYGQTAYYGSRFYDPRIAETITFVGRQIIAWSKVFIENTGYKVLYADTDSLFFSMDEIDIELAEYVQKLLNESYSDFTIQYGIVKHMFEVEFQKVYRKAFWGSVKKRYAGHVVWKEGRVDDEVEVVGFEVRRSDSSQFSRKLQSKLFDMLLKEDKTKDEIMRYIGAEIDRLRKGEFKMTEIGIPKGMTKEPDAYDKPSVHVRGALYAMQILGHTLTSKPKMVYISKLPDGLPSDFKGKTLDAICFDEPNQIPPGTVIDIDKMLVKTLKNKLEAIFEALDWDMKELVYHWRGKAPLEGKQETLGDLLSLSDYGTKTKFSG